MEHWVTVIPKGARGAEIHLCKTKPLEKGNTGIAFQTENRDRTYSESRQKGRKVHGKAQGRWLGEVRDVCRSRWERFLAVLRCNGILRASGVSHALDEALHLLVAIHSILRYLMI